MKGDKGIAVIMVVLILAAMIAIAVPFAMSMGMHERRSRVFRDKVRAKLAAEGAFAQALTVLRRVEREEERSRRARPPWNTPDFDTEAEFVVNMAEVASRTRASLTDPRGAIWSARIEDEQGKLNLLSLPPKAIGAVIAVGVLAREYRPEDGAIHLDDAKAFAALGQQGSVLIGEDVVRYVRVTGNSLEGVSRDTPPEIAANRTYVEGSIVYSGLGLDIALAAERGRLRTLDDLTAFLPPAVYERLRTLVTLDSSRRTAKGWLGRAQVRSVSPNRFSVTVADAKGFGPGTRVRFYVEDRLLPGYARVVSVRRGRLALSRQAPEGDEIYIEAEERHPVNVNTAPPGVLRALFAGVGGATLEEADAVADYVHRYVRGLIEDGGPVASAAQVRTMLDAAATALDLEAAKARAIATNATEINPAMSHSTTDFRFDSSGSFTVEAAGVVNAPSGQESARHIMRVSVRMPVDSGGEWTLTSQRDFDEAMALIPGRLVSSWPFVQTPTTEAEVEAYETEGDVRLAVSDTPTQGWQAFHRFAGRGRNVSASFTRTPDGGRPTGAITADAGAVFGSYSGSTPPIWMEAWLRGVRGPIFESANFSVGSRNGFSLSYDGAVFTLTVADATLPASQPGSHSGPAVFSWQKALGPEDWHHVALMLGGTGYADSTLVIDGQPLIETEASLAYQPGAVLVTNLAANPATLNGFAISVSGAGQSAFASGGGAILVDGEIIEYGSYAGGTFSNCRRARRCSHLAEHHSGAHVQPYGYTVELEGDLPAWRATIGAAGELNTVGTSGWDPPNTDLPQRVVTPPSPPSQPLPVYEVLTATAAYIEVTDASEFQNSGYVRVSGLATPVGDPSSSDRRNHTEYVFFASRMGNRLSGLERNVLPGSAGVTQREFLYDGDTQVVQISVGVEGDLSSVPARGGSPSPPPHSPEDWFISIVPPGGGVEWIESWHRFYNSTTGCTYFIGRQYGNSLLEQVWRQFRANMFTGVLEKDGSGLTHPHLSIGPGADVLPVFRVRGPQLGHHDSPRSGYSVTLETGGAFAEALILHANAQEWGHPGARHFTYRASLAEAAPRHYPGNGNSRVMKFPTGELFRGNVPGQITIAPQASDIDEIRLRACSKPATVGYSPTDRGATSQASDLPLMADLFRPLNGPWPAEAGSVSAPSILTACVVRVGDEIAFYNAQSASAEQVPWGSAQQDLNKYRSVTGPNPLTVNMRTATGLHRGLFGTAAADHPHGTRVTFLEGMAVAEATDVSDDSVTLTSATGFPSAGYGLLEGGEVFGWLRSGQGDLSGTEHLRGRFGTAMQDMRVGDLVANLPFRYWSRYVPERDGEELAFFQAGHSSPGATWHAIEWAESVAYGHGHSQVQLKVICRFNGEPSWNTRPTNRPGGLWQFTGTGTHRLGVRADSVEIRVYFEYLTGARDGDDWKRTPVLESMSLTYGSPLAIRRVELVDY